jgi:hypothetical protein
MRWVSKVAAINPFHLHTLHMCGLQDSLQCMQQLKVLARALPQAAVGYASTH